MATGVSMGVAFGNLISTFTHALITPMLGILGELPKFSDYNFTLLGSEFRYGELIDALITFGLTSAVLHYAVVVPLRYVAAKEKELRMRDCPECGVSISKKATKCPNCTSTVGPIAQEENKTLGFGIINAGFEIIEELKAKRSTPPKEQKASGTDIISPEIEVIETQTKQNKRLDDICLA